ncbi:MAG: FAD:protein FMN transferase [Pseudomonadota bacterium]
MQTRRELIGTLLTLPLTACSRPAQTHRRTWQTFGTLVSVALDARSERHAQAALTALNGLFGAINRDWYAWGDGELGTLNRTLQTARSAQVSPPLAALLADAATLGARSGNRFSACTGNLSQTWGLHTLQQQPSPPVPDAIAVTTAQQHIDCQLHVDLAAEQIRVAKPGVVLDLGGIAKGAALRDAIAALLLFDVSRALIDVGGDLMAYGTDAAEPYTIGLRDPRADKPLAAITLQAGESVFSSGDYARFYEADGQRYQHIIDPRSGYPVETRAATVIHNDPVLADVAATALVVGGADEFSSVCDALGVTNALLIDRLGNMVNTKAMQQRLQPVT